MNYLTDADTRYFISNYIGSGVCMDLSFSLNTPLVVKSRLTQSQKLTKCVGLAKTVHMHRI